MVRLPYEVIAPEVDRIIVRMVCAPSWDSARYYWKIYLGYISACGWTDREFDNETLRRIDASWVIEKKIIWN